MRHLVFAALLSLSVIASATQEGQITMAAPAAVSSSDMKMSFSEVGFTYSSINNGMSFASVGMLRENLSGFAWGARGMMPLEFTENSQIYMGQLVGRFIILNEAQQIYIDTTGGLAYLNQPSGGIGFGVFGLAVGYLHQVQKDLRVGASLGADFSNQRIVGGVAFSTDGTLNNRIGINGTFSF